MGDGSVKAILAACQPGATAHRRLPNAWAGDHQFSGNCPADMQSEIGYLIPWGFASNLQYQQAVARG
jgi:hypothetical protein